MTKMFTGRKRIRKDFGRIAEITRMPNLIEVQKSSYDHFLQIGVTAEGRQDVGLLEVFKSVFPIKDFSERAELQFVKYELEFPLPDNGICFIGVASTTPGICRRSARSSRTIAGKSNPFSKPCALNEKMFWSSMPLGRPIFVTRCSVT